MPDRGASSQVPPSASPSLEQALGWDRDYLVHPGVAKTEYDPRLVVEAEEGWLTFANGSRLFDLHSQYACTGVGHGHPKLRAALTEAIAGIDHVSELLATKSRAQAAQMLIENTMEGSGWAGSVRFTTSGTEAVEAAILIAQVASGRSVIVTRHPAYHGWSGMAAAVSTIPALDNGFEDLQTREARLPPPASANVAVAPGPICSNCPLGQSYPSCKDSSGTLACVRETERVIRAVGVERVAGFLTELWCGAAGYLAPDEYAPQIRELTSRLGILWIDDEVIAGMGRTGRWWAFQHYGVTPDIFCAAKGLGSSAVPVGAVVLSRELTALMNRGRWRSYSTFSGHPLAMAAVCATIEIMCEEGLVEGAASRGKRFSAGLERLQEKHHCISSFGGRGLAWAVELVRDPRTGERWVPQDRWWSPSIDGDPAFVPSAFIADEVAKRGLLLYPFNKNAVTINPPLRISDEQMDFALEGLDAAFHELDQLVTK